MENQQVANIEPKKKRAERWKSTGSLFQRMMIWWWLIYFHFCFIEIKIIH